MQKEQFGMMDEGYFVPKSQILAWLNDLLKINISKIQALGSGSIYCQLFDVIHTGKINLQKVHWKAKNDNEFLANFRLLQSAFEKVGIKRHIQVQKLVKAKYQDNLQLIQWFKRYFDLNCGSKGEGYDAVEKRNKVVPDFGFAEKIIVPKVYSGSGQVQPKAPKKLEQKSVIHQKKQQPPKHSQTEQKEQKQQKQTKTIKPPIVPKADSKSTIKLPVKAPSTVGSHTARVKTEAKQQQKKIEKKQQSHKNAQTPTPAKKQDGMKKKSVTVYHQPAKKIVQSATVVKSSAVKGKQLHKNNDQKIKQLQDKLESIKSIVQSGKQSISIVDEIRKLLGLNLIKQEKKVEQVNKEQIEKQEKSKVEQASTVIDQSQVEINHNVEEKVTANEEHHHEEQQSPIIEGDGESSNDVF